MRGLAIISKILAVFLQAIHAESSPQNWPQFKGVGSFGSAGEQTIPHQFGPNHNLLWRIDVPGGNASPIIWGDQIFLAGYRGQERLMIAIDRGDGRTLWERSVPAHSEEEFTHRLAGPAEATPCTDGERVYFYFGNYGLVALHLDGTLAWEKPMSRPRSGMGVGTSPILVDDALVLIRDGSDDPCVLSLDPATGEEIWKHPRLGYRTSHSSPFVWENELRTELVIAGTTSLVSLDPRTGRLLWEVEDTNGFPCTTPTGNAQRLLFPSWSANSSGGRDTLEAHFDDELEFSDDELADPKLFFKRFDQNNDQAIEREELPPSRARDVFKWLDRNGNSLWELDEFSVLLRPPGRGRNVMVAIKPGGEGLLNDTEYVVWEHRKHLPYVASPLISENRVYLVKSLGVVSCLNVQTGEPYYSGERAGVKGEYFASPLKVGDAILTASSLGSLILFKDSETFELIATNSIDEEIVATPAIVDNTLYVRSLESLWAFKGPRNKAEE